MSKIISVVLLLLVIGGGIFLISSQKKTSSTPAPTPTATSSAQVETTPAAKIFTLADVAKHATADDCWLAIEGKVYDVTKFIPNHPGGQAILQGCGKDATTMFNSRPNDGTSHSPRARETLAQFLLGDLTK